MGESNSIFVFKGPTHDEFRDVFCAAVRDLGGACCWDTHVKPIDALLTTSHNGNVHAAYIHWEEYRLAMAIGTSLNIPWINVRIQQGSLWDYSLYRGSANLDNFSTMPEYWDPDPSFHAEWRGNPDMLAATWDIPVSRIAGYFRPWYGGVNEDGYIVHAPGLKGKAYPEDEFAYGDIWQINDFVRALGAHDPNWDQPKTIGRLLERPARQVTR